MTSSNEKFSLDEFIKKIEEGVIYRSEKYSTDAYFDLPESITIDEIKSLIKRTNSLKIKELDIRSRLYAPRRLQVWWEYYPRSCPYEYLAGISPIMDPDTFINFYNKFLQ